MITKDIDNIEFKLKKDFNFSFLSDYGEVFAVFDKQDSGNLCFGVRSGNTKLFLKIAGPSTIMSHVSEASAIERLKATTQIYEDLRHPKLIGLIEHKEIENGYLLVFPWFDGECMGKQYGLFEKFIKLPLNEKLNIYNDILIFHRHVNDNNYIAIDFYDGSIMYNFDNQEAMLCDIEFYSKKPVINTLGRMWGSGRFMSPEEFILNEEIDERSNVFCMGATAFQLFGGGLDRSVEKWGASLKKYEVAIKAIQEKKADRYQSITEYISAWNSA